MEFEAEWDEAALAEIAAIEARALHKECDDAPPLPPPPKDTLKPWIAPAQSQSLEKPLFEFFGFDAFRDGQRDVVEAALQGRDVGVFWATGRGKSVCYQLPALHTGRVAVVVSPLISLMADQVCVRGCSLPSPLLPCGALSRFLSADLAPSPLSHLTGGAPEQQRRPRREASRSDARLCSARPNH